MIVFTKSDHILDTLIVRAAEQNKGLTWEQARIKMKGSLEDEEFSKSCLSTLTREPFKGKWSGALVVSAEKGTFRFDLR